MAGHCRPRAYLHGASRAEAGDTWVRRKGGGRSCCGLENGALAQRRDSYSLGGQARVRRPWHTDQGQMARRDEAESLPSSLADGRYAVMRQLGRGAQGQTLEAVDKLRGCLVAIKRFVVRGASEWKDVELAEREAVVLASLSHPRLPRYVAHFEEDGCLYLVTEKIEGEPLDEYARRGGGIGRQDLLRLLDDISDALAYLHARVPPIIHRDIKPSNILRCSDGSFVLVDFGSVRDRIRPEGGSTFVGTFGYMAPEQLQGRALPATDTYALGVTLIHLVTGRPPEELPHRGLSIDVEASLAGTLPQSWLRLLQQMVEPDPERRLVNVRPELAALAGRDQEQAPTASAQWASAPETRTSPPDRGRPSSEGAHPRPESQYPSPAPGSPSTEPNFDELWALVARSPLSQPLLLLLVAVELVVGIALHAIIPVVLVFLSVFFGPKLRRAAEAVRQAGDAATAFIRQGSSELRARAHSSRSTPGYRRRGRSRVGSRGDRYRVPPEWPGFPDEVNEAYEDRRDGQGDAKRRRGR